MIRETACVKYAQKTTFFCCQGYLENKCKKCRILTVLLDPEVNSTNKVIPQM